MTVREFTSIFAEKTKLKYVVSDYTTDCLYTYNCSYFYDLTTLLVIHGNKEVVNVIHIIDCDYVIFLIRGNEKWQLENTWTKKGYTNFDI